MGIKEFVGRIMRIQDLPGRTANESESHIEYFADLTLPQLRKRQRIIKAEIEVAGGKPEHEKAVLGLQEYERDLTGAIDRKCFQKGGRCIEAVEESNIL